MLWVEGTTRSAIGIVKATKTHLHFDFGEEFRCATESGMVNYSKVKHTDDEIRVRDLL